MFSDGCENRFGRVEVLAVATAQKRQRPSLSDWSTAGDRNIQYGDPQLAGNPVEPLRGVRSNRAHFDNQRAGFGASQDAARAEVDSLDGGAVRHAGQHYIDLGGQFTGVARHFGAESRECICLISVAIVDDHREARGQEPARHWRPEVPQTDEPQPMILGDFSERCHSSTRLSAFALPSLHVAIVVAKVASAPDRVARRSGGVVSATLIPDVAR